VHAELKLGGPAETEVAKTGTSSCDTTIQQMRDNLSLVIHFVYKKLSP